MEIDGSAEAGVVAAAALINALTPGQARGRPLPPPDDERAAAAGALALDSPSAAAVTSADAARLTGLAQKLRTVFESIQADHLDQAAGVLNDLLAVYPANPILAKEDGRWRLHQHPLDATLVAEWGAICATDLARLFGSDRHDRLGVCAATDCDRVFADLSKNGSRRFCSTACQNRVKSAAFRRRRTV